MESAGGAQQNNNGWCHRHRCRRPGRSSHTEAQVWRCCCVHGSDTGSVPRQQLSFGPHAQFTKQTNNSHTKKSKKANSSNNQLQRDVRRFAAVSATLRAVCVRLRVRAGQTRMQASSSPVMRATSKQTSKCEQWQTTGDDGGWWVARVWAQSNNNNSTNTTNTNNHHHHHQQQQQQRSGRFERTDDKRNKKTRRRRKLHHHRLACLICFNNAHIHGSI